MFKEIIPKIENKRIIIFGEIHGTKEIPEMLSQFFVDIAKMYEFDLCLEMPVEFQNQINYFMENGNSNLLRNISFFSRKNCSDGRNSLEYIKLIETIHKINLTNNKKIQIFCVDSLTNNQNEKEKNMADTILDLSKNKKIFAILGDVHASKREISIGGTKIIPAGLLIFEKLKDKMFNIRIAPRDKELNREESTFNEGFDYVINLAKVTPCSFLEN